MTPHPGPHSHHQIKPQRFPRPIKIGCVSSRDAASVGAWIAERLPGSAGQTADGSY